MRDTFLCQPSFSFMTHSMKRHVTNHLSPQLPMDTCGQEPRFIFVHQTSKNKPSLHPCKTMYRLVQPLPTFYSHVQPCKTKHNLAQPCCSLVRLCTTLDGMVQNTKEIWISPKFYTKFFQHININLLRPI